MSVDEVIINLDMSNNFGRSIMGSWSSNTEVALECKHK